MNMAIAPLVSFALCIVLLRWLLRGKLAQAMLDQPNHRSLHSAPTPRIGGIGVLAGTLGGGLLAGAPPTLFALLLILGGLCWFDDRRGLSVALRLPFHLAVATAWILGAALGDFLPGFGGPTNWPTLIGLVVALGWMMNVYNFMDGANGLAGGMAVFGFSAYGAAALLAGQPDLATLAFVVAAASLAFLVFNFDPARVFLGDSGSIPLGFLAGALGFWGWQARAWPAWFPLLVFSVFVTDSTVTMMRRGLRGEKVWVAHREHYYQRLIQSGWSHRRLALNAYLLMLLTAASACLLIGSGTSIQVIAIGAWGFVLGLLMRSIDRRAPRLPVGSGDCPDRLP